MADTTKTPFAHAPASRLVGAYLIDLLILGVLLGVTWYVHFTAWTIGMVTAEAVVASALMLVEDCPDNRGHSEHHRDPVAFDRVDDAARVEKQYLDFVKKPPEGFTAEPYEDTHDTIDGIKTHTITYQWKASDSEDKPTFMLTTSTDPQSKIQAMISVAILAKD